MVDEKVKLDVRDKNKAINSFLFTDRWIDKEDKLGARTVLKNVYQS